MRLAKTLCQPRHPCFFGVHIYALHNNYILSYKTRGLEIISIMYYRQA